MNDTDLRSAQLYINRELSFPGVQSAVLEQAKDARIPLLERVKFLCISCANLDEFFEIRVRVSRNCSTPARFREVPTACR
jgi:polyphosphate kinase